MREAKSGERGPALRTNFSGSAVLRSARQQWPLRYARIVNRSAPAGWTNNAGCIDTSRPQRHYTH
jgi:hypothetical protein